MTDFKCHECGNHWNEGPTRDYRTDQTCRYCLASQIGTAPEGSHPDEQKPRAATWHQERMNWKAEAERLRALNAALEAKLEAIVKPAAEFIRNLR